MLKMHMDVIKGENDNASAVPLRFQIFENFENFEKMKNMRNFEFLKDILGNRAVNRQPSFRTEDS